MIGSQFDKGILIQSVNDIFKYIDENTNERDVTLWASYMEVYNEQINDLLDQTNVNLKLREDPVEGYYVNGLKIVKISEASDFQKLLKMGEKARHYRQTDVHEHSSRSHSIFRILIENRLSESRRIVVEKKVQGATSQDASAMEASDEIA